MLSALSLIQGNLSCFGATWFYFRVFKAFLHKLQNVAKYAFFVLIFGAQIFICAILYAISISGVKQVHLNVVPTSEDPGHLCDTEPGSQICALSSTLSI